ncbi:MAG: germination protein YpeB [Bacillota bacterium]
MFKKYGWVLSLALGVILLAGIGYWGYGQMVSRRAAETALNNKYSLAFYNLLDNIQNMEVILSKTLVGQETHMDSQLFMRLWQEAVAGQNNLGQIPVPDTTVARTIKFLNQAGAFSQMLANQTADGKPKNEDQWNALQRLYRQAGQLNEEMHQVEEKLSSGTLAMSELRKESRFVLRRAGPQLANGNFHAIDRNMQQFPTLIYDGPFSDHLAKKAHAGLTGPGVTPDQARSNALAFIDQKADTTYAANVTGIEKGKIPLYSVEVTPTPDQGGERINLGVSRQGGKIIWMINSRTVGGAGIAVREAGDKAGRFLEDRGFKNMESTYYEMRNNIAVFNYAATQGGVILYPDQAKVSVALDDGQVIGFDGTNYWMSHRERNLPNPALTAAQARGKLSPRLQDVSPGRLALIPKTVEQEVLTYEFQGRMDNDVFLIYINAVTGEEERVLRVIRTNEGVLTM